MKDEMLAMIGADAGAATGAAPDLKAASGKDASGALSKELRDVEIDKLFEIAALTQLLRRLKEARPVLRYELMHKGVPGTTLVLQSAPGLADPTRSYIAVVDGTFSTVLATAWTNVEFRGQSGVHGSGLLAGDYHEADVLLLAGPAHASACRPPVGAALLVVECKFLASMPKSVLRGLLGLRREMSMLRAPAKTLVEGRLDARIDGLQTALPADPASHLVFCHPDFYATAPAQAWRQPADMFGIDFWSFDRFYQRLAKK